MWPVYIMNKICLIVTQFLMTFCRFSSRIALNNHFYSKFLCFQLNKWSNCRLKEKLIYILTNIYCSKKWSRWSCCSFLLKLIHGFKWAKTKRLLKDRNNFNSIFSMNASYGNENKTLDQTYYGEKPIFKWLLRYQSIRPILYGFLSYEAFSLSRSPSKSGLIIFLP